MYLFSSELSCQWLLQMPLQLHLLSFARQLSATSIVFFLQTTFSLLIPYEGSAGAPNHATNSLSPSCTVLGV